MARGRAQSLEHILVQQTANGSVWKRSLGSVDLDFPCSPSALDQVVLHYLTERLSSVSGPSPSSLNQVVPDYLTQQALRTDDGRVTE